MPRVALAPSDLSDAAAARAAAPGPVAPGARIRIGGDAFQHLARVLRLSRGDRFAAVAPSGEEWQLTVRSVAGDYLVAEVTEVAVPEVEAGVAVTLVAAVPRAERMDWLVEKATELGVREILPLRAERCVMRPEPGGGRLARWERLARAATAQSGRVRPPRLLPACSLTEALASCPGPWLLALERAGTVGLPAAVSRFKGCRRLVWAVGPEGGWTAAEVGTAIAAGAVAVSLGPRILRVETAAVAGLAVVMAALGEMAPPRGAEGVAQAAPPWERTAAAAAVADDDLGGRA